MCSPRPSPARAPRRGSFGLTSCALLLAKKWPGAYHAPVRRARIIHSRPLSSTRGAQRCERALDPERRSEQAAHLVRRDDEGRAGRLRAQREEAGEQPATGPQRAGEGADVLGAPRGIDRAIARVLPDAVERVGQVTPEREDV